MSEDLSYKDTDEIEVDETEESEEEEQDLIRYEISSYPSDMTLQVYKDKWDDKQIIIPEYQRKYVWDLVQASKLIESFLQGIPVPGVFLYKERKTNKLQVIDGQQRILSVIRFFEGNFDDKLFRLKNVRDIWQGKTFKELSKPDQFQLQDSILRATIVQQLHPDDTTSVYHIFERLNTGGTKLSPMEIRKCVYAGSFYGLLERLNTDSNWRRILGRNNPDKRLRDVEFILRFLSLKELWREYEKPMKSFLNLYMSSKINLRPDESEILSSVFSGTCKLVIHALGEKPFHLRGRLNLGVMDSVMTAISEIKYNEITDELKEQIKAGFEELLDDNEFIGDVTYNTSDSSVVLRRFMRAQQAILGE